MKIVMFGTATILLASAVGAQVGTPSGSAGSSAITPPAIPPAPTYTPAPMPTPGVQPGNPAGTPGITPPAASTVSGGMSQQGGKWMVNGRAATKAEIEAHQRSIAGPPR